VKFSLGDLEVADVAEKTLKWMLYDALTEAVEQKLSPPAIRRIFSQGFWRYTAVF
jgi:hypothetical protein